MSKLKGDDMESTRQEHLQWCKDRALAYCHAGKPRDGFMSMLSDMKKHPETQNHPALELGVMLMAFGHLSAPREIEKFIADFN